VALPFWREAAIAADAQELLTAVGAQLLTHLGASSLVVRRLVVERTSVETAAAVRRGTVDPYAPTAPTPISVAEMTELQRWIATGVARRVDATEPSSVLGNACAVVSGETAIAIPLSARSTTGLLVIGGVPEPARLLAAGLHLEVAELIAVVLSNDQRRREIALQREAAQADKDAALARLQLRDIGGELVGADAGLRTVIAEVEQVGPQDTAVLILGETGSGKEVVARAIHARSMRARGPILRVNCGAIPGDLVDSELFGHERGSFTGATAQRRGWFERADGGTLFLDEIGDLPLAAQVRLLRVLQDGVFERVGGQKPIRVDVRIVTATHRDLEAMVRRGTFREDLWYRIGIFVLRIPPLRDRIEDIPALSAHFAARISRRYGGSLALSTTDLALLTAYPWPGNVRELAAVIERAAVLGGGKKLDVSRALGRPASLAEEAPPPSQDFPTLDEAVRGHIERALGACRGRVEGKTGAARLLDVNPHTLRSKMRKLGVDRGRFTD
jgi:hydrogenase-4 transcriptional activator